LAWRQSSWKPATDEAGESRFLPGDQRKVPLDELPQELKRLVEKNPNWSGRVRGLQVTDMKANTTEISAPVSGRNAGTGFDLCCQVRDGLIEFLRNRYPESLPWARTAWMGLDETAELSRPHKEPVEGPKQGRRPAAPGLQTDGQ
jgi:hypothetical protein